MYIKDKRNKRCAAEYKEMVIKQVLEESISYHEAEQKYGISHGSIQKWEQIYLIQGIEGLAIECCDRKLFWLLKSELFAKA